MIGTEKMIREGQQKGSCQMIDYMENAPESLREKIAEAHSILDEACAYYSPSTMLAMFSGGHDSRVALEVARTHPYFSGAAHINTTIGIERTRQYVRDTCANLGISLKEYLPPVSYREIVLEHGFPGPGGHLYMYSRLKERAVRQLVREHKRDRDDHVLLVTGVRLSESKRRMGHVKPIQREGRRVWVAPILNWTDEDKQALMLHSKIQRNPIVDQLCMSGECLCGAFAKEGEIAEIQAVDPVAYAEIKALQIEVAAAGKHAVWGTRPPGQRGRSKSGALCHSCDAKSEDDPGPVIEKSRSETAAPRRRSTQQIQELLRIYAEQGRRLEDMPVLLGREVSTLKKHARAAGAAFEDYRPRARV